MRLFRGISRLLHWCWQILRPRLWLRHRRPEKPQRFARLRLAFFWGWRIALVLLALDTFYLIHIWPNWKNFKHGQVAKSQFIRNYEISRREDRTLPPLRWQPVPIKQISPHIIRTVIVAEDSRFYQHSGLDLVALKDAIDYNLENLSFKYGASTISQQTVKNMFFSPSRNPLRKWHELVFTLGMEFKVSKRRIIETYLNVAEFGTGIYGIEAAAKYYYGKSAAELDEEEATELAATLPAPRKNNPQIRGEYFEKHKQKIQKFITQQEASKS